MAPAIPPCPPRGRLPGRRPPRSSYGFVRTSQNKKRAGVSSRPFRQRRKAVSGPPAAKESRGPWPRDSFRDRAVAPGCSRSRTAVGLTRPNGSCGAAAAGGPSAYSGGCGTPDSVFWPPAAAAAPPGSGASGRRSYGSLHNRRRKWIDRAAWISSLQFAWFVAEAAISSDGSIIPLPGRAHLSRICKVWVKLLSAASRFHPVRPAPTASL